MKYRNEMIPLDLKLTILCDRNEVRIEIEDKASSLRIAEITVQPKDFTAMLGRLACVPAQGSVLISDDIGKTMEVDEIAFPIDYSGYSHEVKKEAAEKSAVQHCPKGWQPDLYFGSQNSFFVKDGQQYARAVIRRWVKE